MDFFDFSGINIGDENSPERYSDIILVIIKLSLTAVLVAGVFLVKGNDLFPDIISDTDNDFIVISSIVVSTFIIIPFVMKTKFFRLQTDNKYLYYSRFNKPIKFEIEKCYFFYRKVGLVNYLCIVDDNGEFFALKCPNAFKKNIESFILIFLTPYMMGKGLCDYESNHIGISSGGIVMLMVKACIFIFLFGAFDMFHKYIEYGNIISASLYIILFLYLFVYRIFTYIFLENKVLFNYFIFNEKYFYSNNSKYEISTLSRVIVRQNEVYSISVMRDKEIDYLELFCIYYKKICNVVDEFENDLNEVLQKYPRIIRS
ncbi:hypothetical protein [Breznakia pachnodae]|uniref:Uncharacterized protein n=1 Tax=Breznakia pachnodae TaxID=265178 RepID=A0ABU0E544_9FIRM|nr:hypothetical protein [Breznakia pachnodae]MDQ0362027.1 hypothetical protein [Breznakia pachnodae]